MSTANDIESAFDAAIALFTRTARTGLSTADEKSVTEQLGQLEFRLRTERAKAVERGAIDPDWIQKTVRWVVEWMPESNLTIIAALGRIARIRPAGLS
jgi:hypothetical protein